MTATAELLLRPDQLSPWQERAMTIPEAFDLFLGGGRGPGKTHLLAALFLRHCEQYGDRARCLVVRKSFPGLEELEAEFLAYFRSVYGRTLKHDAQKHHEDLYGVLDHPIAPGFLTRRPARTARADRTSPRARPPIPSRREES